MGITKTVILEPLAAPQLLNATNVPRTYVHDSKTAECIMDVTVRRAQQMQAAEGLDLGCRAARSVIAQGTGSFCWARRSQRWHFLHQVAQSRLGLRVGRVHLLESLGLYRLLHPADFRCRRTKGCEIWHLRTWRASTSSLSLVWDLRWRICRRETFVWDRVASAFVCGSRTRLLGNQSRGTDPRTCD